MVRPTDTQRKIGKTSADQMAGAIRLVIEEKMSIREAARETNIAFQTLHRYVKKAKLNPEGNIRTNPHYDVRKIFTAKQEQDLAEYLEQCSAMAYGLSTKEVRKLAYEMALINNLKMPDSWKKYESAGKDWLRGFLHRNGNLSIRTPEACSLSRLTSFNKHNIDMFFDNLKKVYERLPQLSDGSRTYNFDETGLTTVQKPKKVVAKKGVKQLNKCSSAERGQLITAVVFISGIGTFIPPVLIFPRKNFKQHMVTGAPAGTLGLASPSGWMVTELFPEVLNHFIKYTGSSKENPTLLICDNHESHISITALNIAKENGVTILTIPPHTSHKIQPLDVSVYGPLKAYYNEAVDNWLLAHPGIPLTIYQVAECFGKALSKAVTPSNIIAGFKKSGIFPLDRDVFTESDFLTSSVTDRPQSDVLRPSAHLNVEEIASTSEEPISTNIPTTSKDTVANKPQEENIFISPKAFKGYPKALPRKQTTKGRKRGKTAIMTDTPEKTLIAELALQRELKKQKEMERKKQKVTKDLFSTNNKQLRRNAKINESSESSNGESDSEVRHIMLFNSL